MRKFWSILLMIVISVSFSACGEIKQVEGEDEGEKTVFSKFEGELERDVTIRILENDIAKERGYLDYLLTAFNETYKEFGIKAVDANMDQFTDLEMDGPYGYGPDVLYQANDLLMKYVDGRHILPLPVEKLDCYDKVKPAAWEAYKTDVGEETYTFAVPVNIQAPMLYYRKDLLPIDWNTVGTYDKNENDIPDMIENWNDMYRFSKHLKDTTYKFGYMKSLNDAYFASGFLFSYGAYCFGDNNTNPRDIGFSKGEAEKGAMVIRQQASVMDKNCQDDTITVKAYSQMAAGNYFATMTTPDVYTTFEKELSIVYKAADSSLTDKQVSDKVKENLIMTDLPKLPVSGDLTEINPELMPTKSMGGINAYAISSYTESPKASLAFVDFATKFEAVMQRNKLLGIAPARSDAAAACGELSQKLFDNLNNGLIIAMPSIKEVAQIWVPMGSFLADVAGDPFRNSNQQKFVTLQQLKTGLAQADKKIYDAIFTLA